MSGKNVLLGLLSELFLYQTRQASRIVCIWSGIFVVHVVGAFEVLRDEQIDYFNIQYVIGS